jgi:hypothetical protein
VGQDDSQQNFTIEINITVYVFSMEHVFFNGVRNKYICACKVTSGKETNIFAQCDKFIQYIMLQQKKHKILWKVSTILEIKSAKWNFKKQNVFLPVMGILSPSISRATKLNHPEFLPVR